VESEAQSSISFSLSNKKYSQVQKSSVFYIILSLPKAKCKWKCWDETKKSMDIDSKLHLFKRDFRFPLRRRWELRSSWLLCSKQW